MARSTLRLDALEDRCTPALTIQFDYRFDSAGFFDDPSRRAMLEQAGHDLASRIASTPQAIVPSGGNTWSALFHSPATGTTVAVPNLVVPEGTLVVFAGGRDLAGGQAAVGGSGGYSVGGSSAWIQTVASRGLPAVSLWGGSISFDTALPWYTGPVSGLTAGRPDLYTVATHELGHVLGFGTSTAFTRWVSAQTFTGPTAVAVHGSAPGLAADLAHFVDGTTSNGGPAAMGPYLMMNQRYGFTSLDYAILADMGWTLSPPVTPSPPVVPPVSPPPGGGNPPPSPPIVRTPANAFTLSGTADGLVSTYQFQTEEEQAASHDEIQPIVLENNSFANDGRAMVQVGEARRPFADFSGVVRTAIADVDGDAVGDVIAVTGAGGPSRLRVLSGINGTDLIAPVAVFGPEFTGGLFVAAADIDRDGKADVIVSPDRGGGGRVSLFSLTRGRFGDFFGIEDVTFRGGARVAAADVNADGTPDLVVGAGTGGGPRVALFDGLTVAQPKPNKLVADFFAFPGDPKNTLRHGVYVAAGDLNADGKADLIFGAGPGGGPRVFVLDGARVLAGDIAAAYLAPLANFFAFTVTDRGGVQVAVKDLDGDGAFDLLAGSGEQNRITTFNGATADWSGHDPANGFTYAPVDLALATDGIYVG